MHGQTTFRLLGLLSEPKINCKLQIIAPTLYLAVWTLHVHHELLWPTVLIIVDVVAVLNVRHADVDGHQGGLHQLASTRGHYEL